eukprot:31304-Pelagococcus_subviridis.AAC.8
MRALLPPRMRPREQTPRRLPELVDLRLEPPSRRRRVVVRQRVKHVVRGGGGVAGLFPPEDQVDPRVQAVAHVLALQRVSVFSQELGRGVAAPSRELDVRERDAVFLSRPQRESARVQKEISRTGEKLRRELLHVRPARHDAVPRVRHGVKQPVRRVELAALQPQVMRGRGAHEPVQNVPRGAVVTSVHKRRPHPAAAFLHRRVPIAHELQPLGDPRHDRPLREIVEPSAGDDVEVEQIVQVRDAAFPPRHRHGLEPPVSPFQERGRRRRSRWRLRSPRPQPRRRGDRIRRGGDGRQRVVQGAHARLPRRLRPQREQHRGAAERPSRRVAAAAATVVVAAAAAALVAVETAVAREEYLHAERPERLAAADHGARRRDRMRPHRAAPRHVVQRLKVHPRGRDDQAPGLAHERRALRRGRVEQHALAEVPRPRLVEPHLDVVRLRRRQAAHREERQRGLEHERDVRVREVERPRVVAAVFVDDVRDVFAVRAKVHDARARELERGVRAPLGVHAGDVAQRELQHRYRALVRVEQERLGEEADDPSELPVRAVERGRGRQRPGRGAAQADVIRDVVLALVHVEQAEPRRGRAVAAAGPQHLAVRHLRGLAAGRGDDARGERCDDDE